MSTGFERIVSDRQLQDHWIRRLIAVIIDYIIVLIATWLLTTVVSIVPQTPATPPSPLTSPSL